jgi:hypothetical protein
MSKPWPRPRMMEEAWFLDFMGLSSEVKEFPPDQRPTVQSKIRACALAAAIGVILLLPVIILVAWGVS